MRKYIVANKWNILLFLIFALSVTLIPFNISNTGLRERLCLVAIFVSAFSKTEWSLGCLLYSLPYVAATAFPIMGIDLHLVTTLELVFIFKMLHHRGKEVNLSIFAKIVVFTILFQFVPFVICDQSISNIIKLISNALIFYLVFLEVKLRYVTNKFLSVLLSLGILTSCYAGFYYLNSNTDKLYDIGIDYLRYKGLWTDPNFMGMFCLLAILTFLNVNTKSLKALLLMSPLIIYPAYIGTLTLSRSFLVISAVVLFIYVLKSMGKFSIRSVFIIFVALVAASHLINYALHLMDVRTYSEAGVTNGRADRTMLVIDAFSKNIGTILFGIGFENSAYLGKIGYFQTSTHNSFADLLTQFGIIFDFCIIVTILKLKKWIIPFLKGLFDYDGHIFLVLLLYAGTLSMLKYEFTYVLAAMFFATINNVNATTSRI